MTAPTPPPTSDPYFDIGSFHRKISSTSSEAQVWFDRSLVWIFGFHSDEAIYCGENALLCDPTSAMAHWAIITAHSPNYAKHWSVMGPMKVPAVQRAHELVPSMLKLAETAPPVEAALCRAIVHRYPAEPPKTEAEWNIDALNKDYARAMGEVYDAFPDDLDVAALYADALMSLSPWKLWDLRTGEPLADSQALRAKHVLDKAYAQPGGKVHPGVLHMLIHLTEMSTSPESGIPPGDRLHGLIPDASHLNHMPSHLYVLIGDYRRAISANGRALFDDELYTSKGRPSLWYAILRLHNAQSLIYAAMGCGNWEKAKEYTGLVDRLTGREFIQIMPLMFEGMGGTWAHVHVRFGKWKEILARPLETDEEFYPSSTAMQRYARGVALAATGQVEKATAELAEYRRLLGRIPEGHLIFPNKAIDVLRVGEPMMEGEIEYRKGNHERAFEFLRESIKRYDNLVYGEVSLSLRSC